MAVLAGLERANGGSIHVAGLDFAAMDEDDLARARRGRIGIVLQAFHLLPTMAALENVAVPLELAGHADPFGRAAADLAAVGLSTVERRVGTAIDRTVMIEEFSEPIQK